MLKQKERVRLNILLQRFGVASRRKADQLIALGAVKVNGEVVSTLGVQVDPHAQILVHDKPLKKKPFTKQTYLFHKPFMTITSRSDPKGRSLIFELPPFSQLPANVQPVGRLDYRSEGLLVLTNDGNLSLALTHPKFSVEKTYAVLVSSLVTPEEVEKLRQGVSLDDGIAKPLTVKILSKEKLGQSTGHWLEIVVTEGRNRLVRRMMEALGLCVVRLVRVAVGDLRLPSSLEPGQLRPLTPYEAKYLEHIKKNVMSEKRSNLPSVSSSLPKEILEIRKVKRRLSLNDAQYALKAQRRDIKARKIAKERKASVSARSPKLNLDQGSFERSEKKKTVRKKSKI
jgi:23S rRNA pseudouridine2605 synthase